MAPETRRHRPPAFTLAFTLLLCLGRCLADEKCTTGFTVVAPEVAVPGKTTVVLVTLHDATAAPVNVSLRLESQPNDGKDVRVLVAESRMIVGHGIIPLSVPQVPAGACTLHTSVGCGNDDCSMRSHAAVRLLGPVRDVIVRPARHTYKPGETITFWVLALDHDLRLARDVLGSVTLQDPAGTKVSIWEQVSLDEGVKKFTIPLSNRAAAGSWLLSASAAGGAGAAPLTVSAAGGAGAGRERAAGERHEVELRFAGGRRWYKPGLRFEGRVEAVSTERSVRVRVKLFDGSIAIYSQDIEMAQGDGSFTVPTVLADSDVIYLQAELVSVEGKEIESHYVLAREPIHKWNSTSQCYLLISGLRGPFQPGSTAAVSIASTCECGRSALLLAVTTAGRATHWAAPAYQHATEPGTPLCTYNYSFTVLAEMAPVSQLLAYYLTEDGESVSDVSSFEVRLLHKEVAVVLEERRFWYPRQPVNMRILAEPGATVCLIGGRSASDDKFEPHVSSIEEPTPAAGELGLVWAGVSLSQRRCGARGGALLYRRRRAASARAALLGGEPADRLWMWKCFNYSALFATEGLTISAPAEAGAWTVWALSLSARGLRFSPARRLAVFRPIQLDFRSPPVLKVGETVEVDIRIGNNINSCMDVSALLSLSAGAQFLSNGMMYVTERLRLGPGGATSLVVKITVTTTGNKNVSVEVTGYSADNCDESYLSFRNETLVGSVVRSASIFVQPEGLLKTDTESAYFCANEHLLLSTRSQFVYEWVPSPRNRAGLVFEVRSGGPVHVALSEERDVTESMYHLVINSEGKTWIGRGKHVNGVHLTSVDTELSLSDDFFTTYWLSWDLNTLSFGRGPLIHNGTIIQWKTDRSSRVHYIGFASGWGKVAEFRIWNFNDEAGFSQVLELSLPKGVVPGSAQGSLLVAGGLVLPHIELDALSAMSALVSTGVARVASFPTSLAAAAASFAPLLALEHTPHLMNLTHHENIVKGLPGQIQTLLSFRKTDNSFSDHSSLSSHSSTIQILEILSKTQEYFPVDPELLQSVKRWVQARQEENGSFSPLPADVKILYSKANEDKSHSNKRNEPGYNKLEYFVYESNNTKRYEEILERDIETTAETLATLLEIGIENEVDSETVSKARSYLEKHLYNVTSSYPLASLVYGLVLSRSPVLSDALDVLRNASTTEEGEFGWPHPLPRRDAADWLYEEDSNRNIKLPILKNLEDYKASLNVLLIHSLLGDLRSAEPVARYLYYRASTLEQHPELIYTAVKAFSQFGALAYDRHRSLTVSLATAGMELTDTIELNARTLPRLLQLPGLPTKVFVYATGAGCATVQGTITYSTYTPNADNGLLSLRSAVIEEIRPERSSLEDLQGNLPTLNIKTCFRWKNIQRSGVLRLEISLFSGYELSSINPVVIDGGNFADLQHGSKADFIWFVLANISNACPVCITYQVRSNFIISSLRPAYTKIYPVTRPDLAAESFFHTRSGSPLLRGITDDDFITWFGKTESANSNESLDNICECGRICRNNRNETTTTSTQKPAASLQTEKVTEQNIIKLKAEKHSQENKGKHNQEQTAKVNQETVLKRSEMNTEVPFLKSEQVAQNVTRNIATIGNPIIYPTATVTNVSSVHNETINNALIPTVTSVIGHADELVVQKIMYKKLDRETEKMEKASKKKTLPRRKGTLQATYGDKAIYVKRNITIREMPLKYTMSTESTNVSIMLNNKTSAIEVTTKLNPGTSRRVQSDKNGLTTTVTPSTEGSKTQTQSNYDKTTSTEVTTISAVLNQSNSVLKHLATTIAPSKLLPQDTPDSVHLVSTKRSSASKPEQLPRLSTISKSINKEIHQIPPTPFSETSKTVTKSLQSKISPENRDGYVVLDKNELWDILKEVIHVEMDKNSEKLEAESKLNSLKDNIKNTRSL